MLPVASSVCIAHKYRCFCSLRNERTSCGSSCFSTEESSSDTDGRAHKLIEDEDDDLLTFQRTQNFKGTFFWRNKFGSVPLAHSEPHIIEPFCLELFRDKMQRISHLRKCCHGKITIPQVHRN